MTYLAPPIERRLTPAELRQREDRWEGLVSSSQQRWDTPRELLDAAVRRAIGRGATRWERAHAGMSNETYFASAGADDLVVRVARTSEPHFEQERWAIARARERGVPAPEVLLVAHERTAAALLSICVQRRLTGVPLGTVARRRGRADLVLERLLREAGRILASIHTISVEGFGPLDGSGHGTLATWGAFLVGRLDGTSGPGVPEVERACALLDDHRAFVDSVSAHLLHFDYEPAHLLVDEATTQISGVVDFEDCKGGDPAYEFAQWDVIHDAYAPVAALTAGYLELVAETADFERRRLLSELHRRVREVLRGSLPPAEVSAALRRLDATSDALAAYQG